MEQDIISLAKLLAERIAINSVKENFIDANAFSSNVVSAKICQILSQNPINY
jgi:hypothetical protein